MVASDLLLRPGLPDAARPALAELERALAAWDGPGVLVLAGNLFDLARGQGGSGAGGGGSGPGPGPGPTGADLVCSALEAGGGLARVVARFAGEAGRRLVVIPGARDRALAEDQALAGEMTARLGAELAGSVVLEMETGAGRRRVRVVAGEDLEAPGSGSEPGAGVTGVVVGGTGAALARTGAGFRARTGAVTTLETEHRSWMGLPPVRIDERTASWIELEAGPELHARLLYGATEVAPRRPTARVGRLAARDRRRGPGGPEVVAAFPRGGEWPVRADPALQLRRVRRVAAAAIAVGAVVDLISAVTPPMAGRLHLIRQFVPLSISEAADAVVALAGLGLLFLASGVRRGQRRAWAVSVAVLTATAVLHLVKGIDVAETIITLAVLGYLIDNRVDFSAATDRSSLQRAVATVLAAGVATIAAAVAVVEITLALWPHNHPLSPPRAVEAVAGRLVGFRLVRLPDRLDDFLTPALLAVTFGVVVSALWLASRPVAGRHRSHAGPAHHLARAREIIAHHGTSTLDYFALRSDKELFLWGDTVVAYGIYGGVCLVSPDPVGPEAERTRSWGEFRAFADRQGWVVGVIGAGETWLPIYRASGMHDMYVGDEGVLEVGRLDLSGGRHKSLRQAVNRVAKYGYTAEFHDPHALDEAGREEIRAVMTKSRRGDVERGFSMTLGRIFDPADRGLLLAVARDKDGAVVAFCQYVPAPGINGYSLDLMRRDEGEHPNGLIDFLIVETARYMTARGYSGLGLNFATMRAVLAGESGDNLGQRVERWVLRRMSGSMQIESLWKFNAKFDPEWQPRFLVYDALEHLLPVGLAVARAESAWELPIIGRFLTPASA